MKLTLSTILIISIIISFSGCGSVYSNYREVEQLLVIETLGFDYRPGGVELSLAAGIDRGKREPVRLTGSGPTVSAAMDNARKYSFEEELFCAQTNSVLIGEEAARRGLEPYLSYICQSPMLRTDVPVFIIRGGSAREAILNTGDGQHGVSEILRGATEYLQYRGTSHVFKASDIVRASLRHGSALCCVLDYAPSGEAPVGQARNGEEDEQSVKTLAVAGFGVLKDNRLVGFIDQDTAIGVSFLINEVGISPVELNDSNGERLVLEINGGSSRLVPRWGSSGKLESLEFYLEAQATVTELNDGSRLSDPEYNRGLTEALEDYVAERTAQVLRLSRELGADFLGLESLIDRAQPLLWQLGGEELSSLLPELEMSVAVTGRLSHTNDMKESLT